MKGGGLSFSPPPHEGKCGREWRLGGHLIVRRVGVGRNLSAPPLNPPQCVSCVDLSEPRALGIRTAKKIEVGEGGGSKF